MAVQVHKFGYMIFWQPNQLVNKSHVHIYIIMHFYLNYTQIYIQFLYSKDQTIKMKLVQSFLGFKDKKSVILQQRNSILKLILFINVPNIIFLYFVNTYVVDPYMDQIFHYPQMANYVAGKYQVWDAKITTPPGMYHLQVWLISKLFGSSLAAIRIGNCLIFGNIFAIFTLKIYEFQDHNRNNIGRTINLIMTPTIYFFFFLDYTDTASLALLSMAMYYNLVGSNWRMGLASLLSVYVRQNNIIWAAYFLFYRIITEHENAITSFRGNIFRQVISFIKLLLTNMKSILRGNIAQILVFPIFIYYLHTYNSDQLLFGDHSSHSLVFHPTQLLYLSIFICINMPITLQDYNHFIKQSFNRIYYSRHASAAYLFILSACLIIVDKFSYVHQFILSDNRHYVFYIYRYFSWSKYPACLLYSFCAIFIIRILLCSRIDLAKFGLWLGATLLYLGPSELVQFRYFAAPFVLLMFEIKSRNLSMDVEKIHGKSQIDSKVSWPNRMIWGTLVKIVINISIMYVFLFRQFGSKNQQRFMW